VSETDWSDSWRDAFRIELRAEAIGLAARGWEVLPGTHPTGTHHWAGQAARFDGPVPLHEDWQNTLGATAEQIGAWWGQESHNLLVATGHSLDAIEVGADLGRRTATVLRAAGLPVPIAATPDGQWLFLTAPGATLAPELAGSEVLLHGKGSWIPLPPCAFEHGVVHWRVRPEVCGWRLPEARQVQEAIVDALLNRIRTVAPASSQELVGVDRAAA
jgi:hypothetical protein